jgi:uncharacterized Zn finger protein
VFERPARKLPPPAHGIRMKKTGATWWGERWVEALERMSAGYANRLARGRTYARAGRTHDLVVKPGVVTARVTGSRPTPYKTTIELTTLSDAAWQTAVAAMAERAQFTAELLAGEMPKEIDDAFRSAGASLFPAKSGDLKTACSCPDAANPCKHIAATHYVLGEAFDKDPFLLFELRGRTREEVLGALRAARSGERDRAGEESGAATVAAPPIATVRLGKMAPKEFDAWREPPPELHVTLEPPAARGALLAQLGAPPGWSEERSPAELFGPLLRAASERARDLALADGPAAVDAPVEHPRPRGRGAARKTGENG